MRTIFLQVLVLTCLFALAECKKENSEDCSKRYYYYDSGKITLTEIFNKGVISFYDTLSADTINSILKKYQGIHFSAASTKSSLIVVTIDSKSCSETSQLFSVIKKDSRISNCDKYLKGNDGYEAGIYDIFLCKLKNTSTEDQLNQIVARTKTTILSYNTSLGYYLIRADKNSDGDSLDMSNKFYETGYFEYSEPDFISAIELMK